MHKEVEHREEDHEEECVVWFGNVGDVIKDDERFNLSGDEERGADEAYLPGDGGEPAC